MTITPEQLNEAVRIIKEVAGDMVYNKLCEVTVQEYISVISIKLVNCQSYLSQCLDKMVTESPPELHIPFHQEESLPELQTPSIQETVSQQLDSFHYRPEKYETISKDTSFGGAIKLILRRLGKTQKEAHEELHMAQCQMSGVVNDHWMPRASTVRRFSELFRYDLSQFAQVKAA